MTASLKTTNYELPIYAETDAYNILGDQNGAMSKIDTALKENADATTAQGGSITALTTQVSNINNTVTVLSNTVETVKTTADNAASLSATNEQDIGTLDGQVAALETSVTTANKTANDAKTAAAAAQNTANTASGAASAAQNTANTATTAAQGAQTTANNALSNAQTAQTSANAALSGLERFNLTIHESVASNTDLTRVFGTTYGAVYFDADSTRSVFKFYGNIEASTEQLSSKLVDIPGYSGSWKGVDTGFTVKAPSSVIWVERTGIVLKDLSTVGNAMFARGFAIGTNGHIYWPTFQTSENYSNMFIWHPSSLFFAEDFGNQPTTN
nr:MAG TPA: hypothetical protein [Caudoviricetes sp.]